MHSLTLLTMFIIYVQRGHGYSPVDNARVSEKNPGYAYVNPKMKHLSIKPPLPARPPHRRVKLDPYSKGVMTVCKDYGKDYDHDIKLFLF